ncbi:Protein of unknown function DUF58 [Treponema bryantii]|uniref:DUF58 domain-containing protein n=1 Tax=Treponema bryantii TaxID=163 RepID=A0A1H9C0R5_9SPIR|nr:DUF58 domain-containing protein [Treponema bryantii]SEP94830.1 Protein of unknown function DUF58 [Treponema bryantii]
MSKRYLANNESLIKKALYLRLMAEDIADGMKSGNFRSLYRGQGIEFAGVRDYIRGDDIRTIDWNVTARMGRPYIKVFEEERELQLFLITDSSLSMQLETNSDRRTKYASAAETAALVAIAAEINACPTGAVFFDGAIHFSCEPSLGKETTMQILNHLDRLPATPTPGSVLPNAISAAAKVLRKRTLVFVLSDFRCGGWEKPLISLAQKNDVIAINIHDASDEELPSLGTVVFKDTESSLQMSLPSSSPAFKKEWRSFNEMNQNRWQSFCIKHGIMPVVLDTKTEPVQVLNQIFARKAKLR